MANAEHVGMISEDIGGWNEWRSLARITPDLRGANLRRAKLGFADLSGAQLQGCDLSDVWADLANFTRADLTGANLRGARCRGARFIRANLRKANLNESILAGADLTRATLIEADLVFANLGLADLTAANLTGANLQWAHINEANVDHAILSGAWVYGIAAWNLQGTTDDATGLVITEPNEPEVRVDDLEVAPFMYLMLHDEKLGGVINTITSKMVLILGRFTPERKQVLNALRNELRNCDRIPVLFDFDVPVDRDITETVTLLARMARFIIADLTDPASIPMELQAIAPDLAVPIQPIVHYDEEPFSMFATLKKYHWVLPPYRYKDLDELLANLGLEVIAPAEAKREALGAVGV